MEKIKQILLQIFATKIGWAGISILLVIIFGSLSTHSTFIENGYVWCDYAVFAPLAYLLGLSITMIAYALIINPIKKFIKK